MRNWFKSALRTMIDGLGAGACGGPRTRPDKAPNARPLHDAFSAGIHFEPLEPRLLLSASAEGAAAGAAAQQIQTSSQDSIEAANFSFNSPAQGLSTDLLHATEIRAIDNPAGPETGSESFPAHPGVDLQPVRATPELSASTISAADPVAAENPSQPQSADTPANADGQAIDTIAGRRELVVVDGGITDYQRLVNDILANRDDGREITVVVLDPEGDGVAQISDILAERQDLDAVHFVSHGDDRGVKLGDTWIYSENLENYAGHIATWGASLTEGADLLFYGCNLAGGEDGQALMGAFSALTGADVAASVDDTGHALLGGDWDLEYKAGDIETPVVFSTDIQEGWTGLLAETVHAYYDSGTNELELDSAYSWGQTFNAGGSGTPYTVNRISLWMKEIASANKELTVSIRNAWGDAPLASVTILSDSVSTNVFARYDFDFSDITLDDATTYVLRVDYASISGKVWLQTDSSGTYGDPDNTLNLLDNAGSLQTGQDMNFRIVEVTGNTAPTASGVPADVSVTEDTASDFDLSTVTFADSDGNPLIVTLAASDGTFAASSSAGVTIGGSGTGSLTLTGTAAAINTYLGVAANIQYTGASNASGDNAATYTLNANDGTVNPQVGHGNIDITAVNDAPTLTAFAGAIDTTAEDTQVEITLAELKAQGDEADVDGTVDGFVIKAVSSGTLKIGASAATATDWATGSNDTIDAANNAYWTPATDANGTLNAFTAVALDNSGAESATPIQAQVTVAAVNDAPVVGAPVAALNADEQTGLAIQGTGFTVSDVDSSGGAVQATLSVGEGTLTVAGGPAGLSVGGNGTGTVILTGTITQINTLLTGAGTGTITYLNSSDTPSASTTLTVTVNDQGNTGSDPGSSGDGSSEEGTNSVVINIAAVNDPPVITSGGGGATAAVSAAENQSAVTTVTATDVDGDTPTFAISGGADQAKFSINATTGVLAFAAAPDFETPADADADNVYEVQVTALDGNGGTDTQAISVTVTNVNENPVITSGGGGATAAVNAAENQSAVTTVTATDVDGDTPTFAISGGADQAKFSINATTGVLAFAAAPDFETPADADADNVYEVQVTALDGNGGTDTQAISVTVTNVNENPVITSATLTLNEGETVTLSAGNFVISDPDDSSFTHTLSSISGGYFQLSSSPGTAITTFTSAELTGNLVQFVDNGDETAPAFNVTVNDGTAASNTLAAVVTYTAVNDAPTATNHNAAETCTAGIPLNLTDIVVTDVDSANVTVTLTLSVPAAGTLSTGTSGLVTATFAGGVWTASGAIADVNALLAATTFTPTAGYTGGFTIATSVDDGSAPAVTGVKSVTVASSGDPTPPALPADNSDPDPIVPPEPEPEPPPPEEEPAPVEVEEEAPAEADALTEAATGDTVTAAQSASAGAAGSQQRFVSNALRGFMQTSLRGLLPENDAYIDLNNVRETSFNLQPAWSVVPPRAASMAIGAHRAALDMLTVRAFEFLQNALDEMKNETEGKIEINQVVASSAIAVTTGLSVGYVVWLLRSGVLLSSLLSSMPAWRFLDPLPILAGKLDDSDETDEESLESIIEGPSPPPDSNPEETFEPTTEKETEPIWVG